MPPDPLPFPCRWPRNQPSIQAALARVYESGDWGRYDGAECKHLRAALSDTFGHPHVTLCCSGTIAVELALRGLGVGAGREVIIAGYDFPGNFRSVEAVGATPRLVDLADDQWTPDVATLQRGWNDNTAAAIVSHLHGSLAPMTEIMAWAEKVGIPIIEDACQAPGAKIGGMPVASFGTVSILSFGGSKPLTAGRGGAVLTSDPQVAQRIRVFSERGNFAFPLSELQAAVLRPQLEELATATRTKHDNAQHLIAYLADEPLLQPLKILPKWNPTAFYKMAWRLRVDRASREHLTRDSLARAFREQGIPMDAGFRGFLRRSPQRCRRVDNLTNCQQAVDQTLILHHPVLFNSTASIARLAEAIRATTRHVAEL